MERYSLLPFLESLQTLLCECVCMAPGMFSSEARHAQNNDVCFDTKSLLISFAFCASGMFFLFSVSTRTQNMPWFLKDSRGYRRTLSEHQA